METIGEAIQHVNQKDMERTSSRKIRVLLVITALGTGGATNVVLHIASYLNKHPDFDVQIITGPIPSGREDLTPLARKEGISTLLIPSLINQINPPVNLKAVVDLRRIMVQGKYDVVHTHSSVAGVAARFAAMTAGVPVTIHHVHGWALHEAMSSWKRTLYLNLERLSARFTNRIIAVSKTDIHKGLAHKICGEEKFSLIYNGIDLEKFRPVAVDRQALSELGLNPDHKIVGMIGRLDKQKNPLDFIKAASIVAKAYEEVQFLIVGDGPLRPDCERLIRELELDDKFILLGFRDDVARILPTMTIVAMSSLWEGLPLVFLEAISVGKPIVANNVDGAKEIVINGETGFLVTPHKPSEMAERILYLLNNEEKCKEMGDIGLKRAKYFSLQRMVREVESVYRELLPPDHRG